MLTRRLEINLRYVYFQKNERQKTNIFSIFHDMIDLSEKKISKVDRMASRVFKHAPAVFSRLFFPFENIY